MNRVILLLIALALLFSITVCAAFHEQKAPSTGAAQALKPETLLDGNNQWRGGVIGTVPGVIAGTAVKEVSARGSGEAAQSNKPVEYITRDGRGVYKAYPLDYDDRTKCHRVQEKVWEDGKLIIDQAKEVCETDKTEKR